MAYLPLSTANLPDPVIDPAQGSSPEDYFAGTLYTGNSGSGDNVVDVGFAPDLVWVKSRTQAYPHYLYDKVRGNDLALKSNATDAEATVASFDLTSTGFTLNTTGGSGINEGGQGTNNMMSWNWKANGSGVSNTDGSITSSVSANTTSGFSIVKYDGTGTAATVGHGLNEAPQLIFCKRLDRSGDDWKVYAEAIGGGTHQLTLNSTAAASTNSAQWNDTDATSTVFSIGTSAATNGTNQIAYCFHSVDQYSSFGSYQGNGSTDGSFVYTGFRPAFVMTKRTDSTGAWLMYDNNRDVDNVVEEQLQANSSNAEATTGTGSLDFLSNGFKPRGTGSAINASGGTYIYMAFAENPFKYSNAR